MKEYSQCLLCAHVFGRTCKINNEYISDDIYNNILKCNNLKSLTDVELDCDDSCCNENSKYYANK